MASSIHHSKWFNTFKNVTEYRYPIELKVKSGMVPAKLRGTYYKCGPGVFHEYNTDVAHPFDGDGIVSAYRIENGSVSYQARIVDTHHRLAEQQRGKRLYSGAFGTPPPLRALKNTANTNVVKWGNNLLVFCESGAPYVLDPTSLQTIGSLLHFKDGLPMKTHMPSLDANLRRIGIVGDVIGAHPKIIDKTLVFYSLEYDRKYTTITFFELNEALEICKMTPYRVKGFLYLHDFEVTPTHYVFFQHALGINLGNMHKGIVQCLHSKNEDGVAHAVPRRPLTQTTSTTAKIAPGFATHHAGITQSEAGDVCIYSVMYPGFIDFKDLSNSKSSFVKTSWDLQLATTTQETLVSSFVEFPAGDIKRNLLFVASGASSLSRLNREGQVVSSWDAGPNTTIGEPASDGNGHVLAIVHDTEKTSTTLAIFDENALSNGPVAELWLPEHVPTSLHGCWTDCV